MYWGGYTTELRRLVATRALAKYDNNLHNYYHLDRPLYRSKSMRLGVVKKDKSNWFRDKGATTTLMVPATNRSVLARTIRSALIGTGPIGTSVKVIEKPGPSIVSGLIRNNPFPRTHCGRELCPLENCQDKCAVENVTYRADCMLCSTEQSDMGILHPPVPVYIGETSRTLYIRANQHYKDCTRISNYTLNGKPRSDP